MENYNAQMGQIPGAIPNLQRVSAKEFASKFQSKRECWNFLAVECEVFLPPYDNTTIYFVSAHLFDGPHLVLNS